MISPFYRDLPPLTLLHCPWPVPLPPKSRIGKNLTIEMLVAPSSMASSCLSQITNQKEPDYRNVFSQKLNISFLHSVMIYISQQCVLIA